MSTLKAPIVEVIVYVDRARITRRGRTHLSPGGHTLSVGGLTSALDPDSVRASGRGTALKLLGLEVKPEYITEAPEAALAELQQELERIQDEDKGLVDQDAAAQNQIEFLKTVRERGSYNLGKTLASGKSKPESAQALATYLSVEYQAAAARRRQLAQARRELARRLEAVQARLKSIQSPRPLERRAILLPVEAAAETDFEFEVSYAVRGASWEPLYDLRLEGDKVACAYLASVTQHTGEDWPEVSLSLSTARPAVTSTLPELKPWFIQKHTPPPMPATAPAPMLARAAKAQMDFVSPAMVGAAPEVEPPVELEEATVESSGAAVTFRLPRPLAVPSDGAPHKSAVTTLELEAKLDYVTIPKLAEEAFLRARIRNASELILLPGPANIFHGDEFVGKTRLERIAPNAEFEVQLGTDDRIKVERELTQRESSKSLMGNIRRTTFGWKITLTNHLAKPARVSVQDQFPVSRHEELKVKLVEAAPKPDKQTDLNLLEWSLELGPQEKREVSFAYSVEHPREFQVLGMSD